AVVPDTSVKAVRSCKTVGVDNVIAESDTINSFHVALANNRKSDLFSRDIIEVASLADELVSTVTPRRLFSFRTIQDIQLSAEAFSAHASVCRHQIHLPID
ncbi:hypothetical protein B0J11DRAFT_411003, partial [Dendryphion nanum]